MILTEIATAEALTHKCKMCKAEPGQPCVNIVRRRGQPPTPLPGREIHFYRIEPKK